MAEFCYNCFKPKACCLCSYTKEMDSGIKFVLLMHPKEAKKNRTGTGHIARISLTGCEIIMGLDFAENKRLQELLHDHRYFPMMMFPGPEAWTAKKRRFQRNAGRPHSPSYHSGFHLVVRKKNDPAQSFPAGPSPPFFLR